MRGTRPDPVAKRAITATSPRGRAVVIGPVVNDVTLDEIQAEAAERGWTDVQVARVVSVFAFRAGAAADAALARSLRGRFGTDGNGGPVRDPGAAQQQMED